MELPKEILIHNQLLGMKGSRGSLLQIFPEGFYLVSCDFGDKTHRVMLPIDSTVLIFREPEERFEAPIEVER